MSDFPINPEDRPGDLSEANAAHAAWQEDADRFINEELPLVRNQAQRVRDGAAALEVVNGLISQILPVVLGTFGAASPTTQALTEAKTNCSAVSALLNQDASKIPALVTRIQGLLQSRA